MRSLFIFLIILLGLAVGLVPYCDGLLFKYQFTHYIHQLQLLTDRGKNVQITLSDYHVGWIKSTATIVISFKNSDMKNPPKQPLTFNMNILIHHGPIIFVDKEVKYVFAWVEGFLHRPDSLSNYIPDNDLGFLQLSTMIAFNKSTFTTYYIIPETNFAGMVYWKGLTGKTDIVMNGFSIGGINNEIKIGSLNIQAPWLPYQLIVNPGTDTLKIKFNGNQKIEVNHETKLSAITLKSSNNIILQIASSSMNSDMSNINDNLTCSSHGSINGITTTLASSLTSIDEIKYQFIASDFNSTGIGNIKYFIKKLGTNASNADYTNLMNAILKSLTATSKLDIAFNTNTNLGKVSNSLTASLAEIPSSIQDLTQQLNLNGQARAARKLVEFVLTEYYRYTFAQLKLNQLHQNLPPSNQQQMVTTSATTSVMTPITADMDPSLAATTAINQYIQQGLFRVEGDDLVVTLAKSGSVYKINDNSDSEFAKSIELILTPPYI